VVSPLAFPLAVVSLVATLGASRTAAEPPGPDADALFAGRDDLDLAVRAAEAWKARLDEAPADFDVACKLARARFFIGERSPRAERARHFREGVAAARVAIALDASRPDGHFWLGANLGSLAGVSGKLGALRRRSEIREALEASLARDAAFGDGAAFCALGKYYASLPGLFGGSKKKSEELLRRCLAYDPDSPLAHYYLGQTLLALDRDAEAMDALRAALDAPLDPEYAPEGRLVKERAERLLAEVAASDRKRGAGSRGRP
jgi:tetratricopeptide (TPR) repeat protein